MNKRASELIEYGKLCGFLLDGKDGNEHYRLVHPNGETVRVACTPGDRRGDDNSRAEMRRKSGVTPPRPKAGSYSKGLRLGTYIPAEERIESKSAQYDRLLAEHRTLLGRIEYLQSVGDMEGAREPVTRALEIQDAIKRLGFRPPRLDIRVLGY